MGLGPDHSEDSGSGASTLTTPLCFVQMGESVPEKRTLGLLINPDAEYTVIKSDRFVIGV